MTDPASPAQTPPAPRSNSSTPITELAREFKINSDKPFFPVNTMRLLYLIITDGLTAGNKQATDQVNQIIPKISAVFDARDEFLSDNQESNPMLEVQACKTALNDIFAAASSPIVHHTFDLLFSDLYPLQENLLLSLDRHLSEEHLSVNDLTSILKIRSMDSVVYSAIINQVILKHLPDDATNPYAPTNYSTTPIHWQINVTLQLNDLVDAIIHAKQDLESGSATLIEIIKKISSDPNEVEELINLTVKKLTIQATKLPFPQPLQSTIKSFNQTLSDTISSSPKPTPN